jgi:hypothetical protein
MGIPSPFPPTATANAPFSTRLAYSCGWQNDIEIPTSSVPVVEVPFFPLVAQLKYPYHCRGPPPKYDPFTEFGMIHKIYRQTGKEDTLYSSL